MPGIHFWFVPDQGEVDLMQLAKGLSVSFPSVHVTDDLQLIETNVYQWCYLKAEHKNEYN